MTSALNASPKTSDFIFEAGNSIVLHSAPLTVNGGDLGARGTGSGPFLSGSVAIDIASGAVVQTTHNTIADSIRLNSGAKVGDLQVNRLVNPSSGTHGSVTPLVPLPALPAPAAVTPGTANLTIAGGKTVTASPGQFLTVSLGTSSVLRLNAGTYQIKDLTIGTSGRVEALGTVKVLIANRLNAGSSFFIGPASGTTLTAKDIGIEVSGINGSDGALGSSPKAAALGSSGTIRALLLAPNGTLSIASGVSAKGAFLAKDIDVGSSSTAYTFEDGFPNSGGTCTPSTCDDGNPCTVDSCGSNGVCSHTPAAVNTSCSDGNACNGMETCDGAGTCKAGTPVTCTAQDQCHVAGTCNPSTGTCSNPTANNGTPCNDGNACTKTDTCQSGVCTGGTATTCAPSDQCHQAGTCNPSTGVCSNPTVTDGTACNDGNACTQGDTCQAGTCKGGGAVVCGPGDQCHGPGVCDPTTGTCSNPIANNGTPCNDGNACTQTDTCQGGTCTGGNPITCPQPDQCHTAGSCNPANGTCTYPIANNGTPCNDGNACTQTDTCQAGTCTGGNPITCPQPDQCHTAGSCNPSNGACSNPIASNGTPCNDGNGCTQTDTCQAGSCTGSNPVTCPQPDQCHTAGSCNPASGTCTNPAVADGTACNDGNACTQTDTCQGGVCSGSNNVSCTALDACHDVGTCATGTGVCSNPQKPAGASCGPGQACTADGQCLVVNQPPVVNAGPNQTASEILGAPPPTFTLQQITNTFTNPVGIEYYQPTNQMMMSVFCCGGEPHNFDLVDSHGNHQQYSGVHGLSDEVYFAIARDEGGGFNRGGFPEGQMLVGTGAPGTIARISPDGSTIDDPWVVLPGEFGLLRGQLQFDRTGLYGGDLLVTTTAGHLWRVNAAGQPTQFPVTMPGGFLEGLAAVPDDPVKYGPWAGKILTGDEGVNAVNAVDALGNMTSYQLGIFPENISIVPANENFFGVDYFGSALWGASASQFTSMVGDVLITEEFGGAVWDIKWNGTSFDTILLTRVNLWEHTAFGPAGISEVGQTGVSIALNGTASDDGLPTGSSLTVSWSVVSGPGPVSFGNPLSAATTATFTTPGTYILRLTASDGQLTTTSDTTITVESVDPANQPPVANAGADQTITLPQTAHLVGSATDDGLPMGSKITTSWSHVSGPAPVTFVNSAAAITDALFPAAGTYVLQLTASDSALTGTADVTIVVNPAPSLSGASLVASLSAPGPLATGSTETVNAVLTSGGNPISNEIIQVTVTGANPTTGTTVTDAGGHASFTYIGTNVGQDQIQVVATDGVAVLAAPPLAVAWNVNGGVVVTQGWIASPTHQATLTGQVPIVLSDTVTLVSGTVSYWALATPSDVHIIDNGAHGTPGATIATFDTTTLKNGSYVVDLTGVDTDGHTQDSAIAVTVSGDYKPGRMVVEVTDMTIPLAGLPITIGRRYDSLDKDNVGDFGNGWSLKIGHPDLQVDPAHNVTMTIPNGRRVTFYFTPTSYPFPFSFLYQPTYLPEAGVFGKLTSDGCDLLVKNNGSPVCFLDSDPEYRPTTYTYSDPYGTVYTLGADGTLKSIRDLAGNTLTFSPHGIQSSAGGLAVSFERDAQNRITEISTPPFDSSGLPNKYDYTYTNGDLTAVQLPPGNGPILLQYAYDGEHRLLTAVDANGHSARTSTYDAAGRLATDTDALGNVTAYAYDIAGHKITTTFPDEGVRSQAFDDRGLLLSETDPLGRTTAHQYDANRNETKRTNALGESTVFTYDANGNQTSRTNALGETTTTTYNAFSEPLTTTDPVGNATTIAYDDTGLPTGVSDSMGPIATFASSPQGLPTAITDALGGKVAFRYDTFGNLISRADRLTRTTNFVYDGLGRRTKAIDPRGGVTSYTYLPSGMQSGVVDPVGDTNTMAYDGNGNLTSTTDTFGPRATTYAFDADNHRIQVTHPDGTTTKETRDFRGNLLTSTDESGQTTSYAYDLAGELILTIYADGTSVTQTYDALGRLFSMTDERGNTTTYAYQPGCDCSDRQTAVTDPLGRTTSMTYDGMGRLTSKTDANGHQTLYTLDLRGRRVETDYADGTATHDTYDPVGRRVASTDQTGATTHYGYDSEDQLISVTDPLGAFTQYAYDNNGNLSSVTDANGHTTTYAYDANNRKTQRRLPLGMAETFAYDPVGNGISHVDFRGKVTTYAYDLLDRRVSKVPDPSLGEPTVTFAYNPTGTRAGMTDASGTTGYTYDTRNRLLSKATPEGTLTYTYDARGNVASIQSSNANGTSVSYDWDAANQLASVTDNRLDGVTKTAYTATGLPASLAQPNGVGVTYSYDSLDRVTSMNWNKGTGPTFASWTYAYNQRGQRLSSTDLTGRQAAYAYDAAARLASETITGDPSRNGALTYSLDAVGNRLSRTSTLAALGPQTFSYDGNDELMSDSYDLNGNTTGSGGHTYGYDFENRLVSKDGGALTLIYDGDGNRVSKTAGGITTQYLVDQLNPTGYLQVLDEISGGAVQVRYTYGNVLLSQTRNASATPATSFYGYDAQGNITFLTDATGAPTVSYDYDAWGDLIETTGASLNSRLYQGEEFDPDLGFTNLRARQYASATGRFLNLDPEAGDRAQPRSLNRYLYALGDPANLRDPSGRAAAVGYGIFIAPLTARQVAILKVTAGIAAVFMAAIIAMTIQEWWDEILKDALAKEDWHKIFQDPWNQWNKCWQKILAFLEKVTLEAVLEQRPIDAPLIREWIADAKEIFRTCLLNPPGGAN